MNYVYIAGKMTGVPQFNIPAFDSLAAALREQGFAVKSPAELDDPATRAAALASVDGSPGSGSANGETWGDFLSRDVKLLADGGLEGIVVLPGDAWKTSRGARLETFVGAQMVGLPILQARYDLLGEVSLDPVPFIELVRVWSGKQDISFHTSWPDPYEERAANARREYYEELEADV